MSRTFIPSLQSIDVGPICRSNKQQGEIYIAKRLIYNCMHVDTQLATEQQLQQHPHKHQRISHKNEHRKPRVVPLFQLFWVYVHWQMHAFSQQKLSRITRITTHRSLKFQHYIIYICLMSMVRYQIPVIVLKTRYFQMKISYSSVFTNILHVCTGTLCSSWL